MLIESQAKIRLADEYDAAQERGEAAVRGRPAAAVLEKRLETETFFDEGGGLREAEEKPEEFLARPAQLVDLELTKSQVHEARQLRNAERADPGIVRRTVEERVTAGLEPQSRPDRKE